MDNISLLLKVFFFKDLNPDELLGIMAITRREQYRMGQQVFAAGEPSDSFYIVKKGSAMVKNGPMVLATLEMGDTIGEMSFVDRGERSATVAAIDDDTELLKIPFEVLDELFDRQPELAVKIYRALATVLSRRLREMDEAIRTRYQPVKF
jgi:CRP-like cAMP-binding protein